MVPVPGKVCPEAEWMRPLLAIWKPVSAGGVPERNSRFKVADGLVVLLPSGSAFHWKVWFTGAWVLLLKEDAARFCGCEIAPLAVVAGTVGGKLSSPRRMVAP